MKLGSFCAAVLAVALGVGCTGNSSSENETAGSPSPSAKGTTVPEPAVSPSVPGNVVPTPTAPESSTTLATPQAPSPPVAAAKATMPKCQKAVAKVIKQGKKCGLDMSKYDPTRVCDSYHTQDNFSDEQGAGRMKVFLDSGCAGLQAAVDGDRI